MQRKEKKNRKEEKWMWKEEVDSKSRPEKNTREKVSMRKTQRWSC